MVRGKKQLAPDDKGVVVLDSGALTKVAAGDAAARQTWRQLTERGWTTSIPAVTLAETTTGAARTDTPVNILLKDTGNTVDCDEYLARVAGVLRSALSRMKRPPSGIDAIVAAVAASTQPAIVMTTDPEDMNSLLARQRRVAVIRV